MTTRLTTKLKQKTVIGFTGSLASGKDYVAAAVNAQRQSLAAPMYALTHWLFGYGDVPRDKTLPPGLRECWQTFGQWGKGIVNEQYPLTPERAMFTRLIRDKLGHSTQSIYRLKKNFGVQWQHYGLLDSIWISGLCRRLDGRASMVETNSYGVSHVVREPVPEGLQAVTNLRFPVEVTAFEKRRWAVVHVLTSPEELRARHEAQGVSKTALENISESLAARLNDVLWATCNRSTPVPDLDDWLEQNDQGFVDAVVWSSERPKPNPDMLTVSEFATIVKEAI
jgi:hypothetical protein